MISVLLLNPCIDRTVFINGFRYGEMNRIADVENIPSGKGTNVTLALNKLGAESALIMFGTIGEDPVKKRIESFGIKCDKVEVFDSIRINTKINNTEDNVVTEINEKGSKVSGSHIEQIIKLSVENAKKSDYFVLTGSMPEGCKSSLYAEIMAKIKATSPECRLVLDAEGENFKRALKQKPYIIKPNKYELEMYCRRKLDTIKEIAEEGMKLHHQGIEFVIISMGAQGGMICCNKGCFYALTPKIDVLNTVGAGDSMLSAVIIAVDNDYDAKTIIKYAVAAGCSAATCSITELINIDKFSELIKVVQVEKIEI